MGDAVKEIIEANPSLRFGFHYGLFNLTQTARFLKPLVEARLFKDIQLSALVMSLSRYARSQDPTITQAEFRLDHVRVQTNLISVTWPKSERVHSAIGTLFRTVEEQGGFLTLSEGINEITIITERQYSKHLSRVHPGSAAQQLSHMAGIGVKFGRRYLNQSGLLYHILQQVALQGINVLEVSSTATEFVVYVDEGDAQLAFESIYQRFMLRDR